MKESISVIFPVKDSQFHIEQRIEDMLEILTELSRDVQIIAVDDQSSDATPEILDEMRRRYPQIQVLRKQNGVGPVQSVESALYLAKGEFIFLHQTYDPIDLEEVAQLWKLRKDDQLVIARAATRIRRIDQQLLQRLHDWGRKLEENWPPSKVVSNGLQMMRREGVKSLSNVKDSLEELEVTHQSHRKITAPKFIYTAQASAKSPEKSVNSSHSNG